MFNYDIYIPMVPYFLWYSTEYHDLIVLSFLEYLFKPVFYFQLSKL